MRRFFVEDISESSIEALIKGDEFVHLKKVLRLSKGSSVSVFNGRGLEFAGRIETMERDSARVRLEARVESKMESPIDVTLIQGLVKGGKPELIIQKATELGVVEILFYSASRTVPAVGKEKVKERLLRWKKVSIGASKQCGRSTVPGINVSEDLKSAVSGRKDALKLVLLEGAPSDIDVAGIKDVLSKPLDNKGILVLVGPEGGFSTEEVKEAISHGFTAVGLGPRILRSETAAIAAISIIQYAVGDMKGR